MTLKRLLAFTAFATLSSVGLSTSASPAPSAQGDDRLVVHEWGTFTALQDEHGKSIGGINTDDEPVPEFVHTLRGELLQSPSQIPPVYFKGWPRCDQDVLVRLETPVIYFHLPANSPSIKLDVDVQFNGGWLTQFYPNAKAKAPGLGSELADSGVLNDKTVGELHWHDLTIGGTPRPRPKTADRVWTAPRAVEAADVSTPEGESERYLFYRGVGHMNAPLQVSRDTSGNQLQIRCDWSAWVHQDPSFSVGPLWLVDVREDGTSALRTINPIQLQGDAKQSLAQVPATFSASNYRAENLGVIRQSLKDALVREGLYGDEADGLLNTWEVSYFKRPGLRLFFMVPPVWTQHYLPLRLSQSAYITRVMVGRIELVTPRQRALLKQIAQGPISKPDWVGQALRARGGNREDFYREDWYKSAMNGKQSLTQLGIQMPEDYREYLELGRFRNALILDEVKHNQSSKLQQFVKNYELEPSR